MGAPAKFLFDTDFGAPGGRHGGGMTHSPMQAAEARGYQLGFEAGQRDAAAQTERAIANATSGIANALNALAANFTQTQALLEGEAVDIAVAVGRKLAAGLLANEPMGEIAALVNDCFRQLVATPHLAVRIHDSIYEPCRIKLEDLAKHSAFQGKLVILAEPDVPPGDCRIEWADGGVVLDRREIESRIADLVGRYMATRANARTTP